MKRVPWNILLTGTGMVMILCALALTSYNLVDAERAEKAASTARAEIYAKNPVMTTKNIVPPPNTDPSIPGIGESIPDYLLNPAMDMPEIIIDGQEYVGTLSIPALDLELPVLSGWDYEKLKLAPCQYAGTVYAENMVIAAHNYTQHFGKLSRASLGDIVTFVDIDGNRFQYEIAEIEVLAPESIEEMVESAYPMTLFTCNYAGNKRITVRCIATA